VVLMQIWNRLTHSTILNTVMRGILHLGESFVVTITRANLGDTSDFQIISVLFPNITSDIHNNIANRIVSILYGAKHKKIGVNWLS